MPVECHFSNLPDSNGTVIKMITFEPMIGTSPTPVLQSQRSDTTSIKDGQSLALPCEPHRTPHGCVRTHSSRGPQHTEQRTKSRANAQKAVRLSECHGGASRTQLGTKKSSACPNPAADTTAHFMKTA